MARTDARLVLTQSGDVTRSINQLVKDVRKIMEPGTASRLRVGKEGDGAAKEGKLMSKYWQERHAARLRDYLVMAPALHVSHMMIFTLTEAANVHMRVARLPAGPTMTFRIERYSLMKWVRPGAGCAWVIRPGLTCCCGHPGTSSTPRCGISARRPAASIGRLRW